MGTKPPILAWLWKHQGRFPRGGDELGLKGQQGSDREVKKAAVGGDGLRGKRHTRQKSNIGGTLYVSACGHGDEARRARQQGF